MDRYGPLRLYLLSTMNGITQHRLNIVLTILLGLTALVSLGATDPTESFSDRIHRLHDHLLEEGKTTQQLSESDLASLPVGITKQVGGYEYLVIIDSARFTPTGAFFDAYVSLPFKTNGQRVAFAARNVAFHQGGLSASNEVRLVLVSEAKLPLGPKTELVLPTQGEQNYVAIDCNGFRAVNLLGKISFDRTLLIPEGDNGEALPGQVETEFRVHSTDWNSMMVSVTLPTFRVPAVPGINFKVEEAILDMSDTLNPRGMEFPAQYRQQYGEHIQLWEGFFIRRARVGLFKELSQKGDRRYVDVENLMLDKQGVSGGIGVNNLFGRGEGSLNGWPFSVDSLGIVLVKNQLSGGGFRGEMNVPLLSKDAPLKYSAFITQASGETEYTFAVQPGTNLEASVLAAKIDLLPSSTIIISKKEGKLVPEAILHGTLSVNAEGGVALKQVGFADLHIASERPYVRSGVWSLANGDGQRVANYPISVESIHFVHSDQDKTLRLDVAVLLGMMNESDKGFAARSLVSVRGEIVSDSTSALEGKAVAATRHQWRYKETRVGDIAIDADMGAFQLEGSLSLYREHAVYGRGFRGEIDASFTAGPTVKAIAQFGRVDGYRYWYADALMRLGNTAPNPGFAVYGFGGGAYYQMALDPATLAPESFYTVQGEQDKTTIGATRSGAAYVPDKSVKLGVKATVMVGTAPSPRPFNGDATFEMAFNQRMGVKYIRFRGEGYFLTGLDERDKKPPMYADLNITYDFDNNDLNALLDLYVDAYGVMRGVNANHHAGRAIMHFGPEKWYVWLGSPSQRIGVNVLGLAESKAYLMVGDEIEDIPAPLDGFQVSAKNLQDVLDDLQDNMARTGTQVGTGKGFVFGASFSAAIGRDDPGAVFYGFFRAGVGFDIMLQDMGNAACKGRTGPIGINGWYASGQAWAYLQGAVGINVNLKFVKGKFEAFRFLGAVVMQAQMPNPVWVQGTAFGEFNILNGLVKGDCNFQVTIGEQCEIESGPPISTEVIADMQPMDGNREVDVFTTPQVAFNIGVETPIEMLNLQDQKESYRVKLNHLRVTKEGVPLIGELIWNQDKTVVAFKSDAILPPNSSLKAAVTITWQKLTQGAWTDLEFTESREVTFITGEAPDYIPEHNVDYSYPVRNQYTFLPGEHNTGYMKLLWDQSYLFESPDDEGREWNHVARFQQVGTSSYTDRPLSYYNKTVSFGIPSQLSGETVYELNFVKKPVGTARIDENVVRVERDVELAQAENVTAAERDIKGVVAVAGAKTLFTYGFRTSRYNTFSAKVNAMAGQVTTSGIVQDIMIFRVGTLLSMPEVFDNAELNGTYGQSPMVRLSADLNNTWFADHMESLLYQHYPVSSEVTIGWRIANATEPRPRYAITPELRATAPSLTAEQLSFGGAMSVNGDIKFHYEVPTYTYRDYLDLRPKALSHCAGRISRLQPNGASMLISTPYQHFLDGNYDVKLEYIPPGMNQPTTTKTITIRW